MHGFLLTSIFLSKILHQFQIRNAYKNDCVIFSDPYPNGKKRDPFMLRPSGRIRLSVCHQALHINVIFVPFARESDPYLTNQCNIMKVTILISKVKKILKQ